MGLKKCNTFQLDPDIACDDALKLLLRWLNAESDRAGERYEFLHCQLVEFFEQRGCNTPEELADETLDRASQKLVNDATLWKIEPEAYCYGIARNVVHEYWRQPKQKMIALEELPPAEHPIVLEEEPEWWRDTANLEHLKNCLERLSESERRLIEQYHQCGKAERVKVRGELAAEQRCSLTTLHVRVHRLRARVAECVARCWRRKKM